jgi:hypothetical protein
VNWLKIFAAIGMVLMLACSATTARSQTAPAVAGSTISATQSDDAMDQDLAEEISQAWSEGKDASGAVDFQVKGEIALSQGNPQQARRYFRAAEHELTVLRPSPAGAPSGSGY